MFVGEAFGLPEVGVGLGSDAAVLAGVHVPEAAVDEDDLFEAGKHHIGLAGQVFAMQAEAVAHAMDYRTNQHFGLGILPLDLGHTISTLRFC